MRWAWVAVLALVWVGATGCGTGAGVTPQEKEELIAKAGEVAFKTTFDAAVDRGVSVEAAKELALIAQKEAMDLARGSIPVKSEDSGTWGKILSAIVTVALNLGLGMVKEKLS